MPVSNPTVRAISASNSVFSSGTVRLTGAGIVTVASDASGAVISATTPAQSVQTQPAGPTVQAISASNATLSGTVRMTGGPNVTVGTDAAGVSISAAAQSVQTQEIGSQVKAISAAGSINSGTISFANSNGVSFGLNAGTMTGSVPAQSVQTQEIGAQVKAISASNATFSGTVRVTGGPNITVGTDAQGISISGANPGAGGGGGGKTLSYWQNMGLMNVSGGMASMPLVSIANTLLVQPLAPIADFFEGDITALTAMLNISNSATISSAFTSSLYLGIYTMNTGVTPPYLSILNSVSSLFTRAANASNSQFFQGARWWTIHSSQWSSLPAFSEGGHYWLGFLVRTSGFASGSVLGQHFLQAALRSGTMGVQTSTGNTGMGWHPGLGYYSASQTSMPAAISQSAVAQTGAIANFVPHLVLNSLMSNF